MNSGHCRIGTASLSFLTILFPGILDHPDLEDFTSSGEAVTTLTHTRSAADFGFMALTASGKSWTILSTTFALFIPSRRHDLAVTELPRP